MATEVAAKEDVDRVQGVLDICDSLIAAEEEAKSAELKAENLRIQLYNDTVNGLAFTKEELLGDLGILNVNLINLKRKVSEL